MYKKGDGIDKNERQAKIYATVAKDIIEQMQEERQRTRFQEGVESGTEVMYELKIFALFDSIILAISLIE